MSKIIQAISAVLVALVLVVATAAETRPADVVLVLDNSGSMRKNDPGFLARQAVSDFIQKLDTGTHAGLIIFDHKVDFAVPLTPVDDASRAALFASLDGINYRGRLTDSPAAIERAIYELKTRARGESNKVIVFMTDGIVDTGDAAADVEKTKWLREDLAGDAADHGIRVFAIAFTENADFFLIQSIAKRTGGEYFRAIAAEDLARVFATVNAQLAEPPPPPPPAVVPPALAPQAATVDAPAVTETGPEMVEAPMTLDDLSPEERQQMEEAAREVGMSVEEFFAQIMQAPPDEPVVFRPPSAAPTTAVPLAARDAGAVGLLAGLAALFVVLVVAIWLLLRRRRAGGAVTSPAKATAGHEIIPEAFLLDPHRYTDNPSTQLGEKPVMVGRVGGTDTQHLDYFVVNQPTVGRRHAVIKYKDFSFWIIEQGSVNGTFVNGTRISGEHQLKHGDKIRFHKFEFEFSMPEMDDAGHTVFADPHDATIAAQIDATMVGTAATALRAAAPAAEFDDGATAVHEAVDYGFSVADDPLDTTAEGDQSAPDVPPSEDPFLGMDEPPPGTPAADDEFFDDDIADSVPTSGKFADSDGFDDDDDDDFGVAINLDAVGRVRGSDPPNGGAPVVTDEEFDAEASAFFEDITVGPPDEAQVAGSAMGDDLFDDDLPPPLDDQEALERKLDQATAILDAREAARDATAFTEGETVVLDEPFDPRRPDDPNDVTLEQFLQTDSFDAPATVPPANPEEDVTLDAFMSTAMLGAGDLTPGSEDPTDLPPVADSDEIFDVTGIHDYGTGPEAGPAGDDEEDATVLPSDVPDRPTSSSERKTKDSESTTILNPDRKR